VKLAPLGRHCGAPSSPPKTSAPETPAAQDIVPIKQRLGAMAHRGPATGATILVRRVARRALAGVAVCARLAQTRDAFANNPRRRRQRQVAQIISRGIARVTPPRGGEQIRTSSSPRCFRLLQEQLGERLIAPRLRSRKRSLTKKLRPRAVPEKTLTALHELSKLAISRAMRRSSRVKELAALIREARNVLGELREQQSMKSMANARPHPVPLPRARLARESLPCDVDLAVALPARHERTKPGGRRFVGV